MATIASNVFLSAGVAGTGVPGDDAATSGAPSDFMQLVSGMIPGSTSGDQLPSNLVELLLTGDNAGLGDLDGIESTDSDTVENDDEDGDGENLLAIAAFLPGLQAFQPAASTNAVGGDSSRVALVDVNGSQKSVEALLGGSQAAVADAISEALKGAVDGAVDAAATFASAAADGNGASGSAGTSTGLSAAPTQPTSASHLQSMLAAHRAADIAPQAASAEVRTPVGAPGWSDEIGTHLAIMAANGREAASLRLSPEHLGPLEVSISMKEGQASVVFGASNPDTRSALEQSLPRLRELFAAQGLVLGDANVSRDAPRDSFRPATFANATRGSSDASGEASVKPVTMTRLGLVDTYV